MGTQAHRNLPRLTSLFFGFVVFVIAGAFVVLTGLARHELKDMETDIQAYGAARSGQSLQINFTEAMMREWSSVKGVSGTIDLENWEGTTSRLKALTRIGGHIVWAGVVDPAGRVIASSSDEFVGVDVSSAAFYQRGLTGSYAGPSPDDFFTERMEGVFTSERRFIDMASAITGPQGKVSGVLVYRLGTSWIEDVLSASADALNVDAFLVDGKGEILIRAGALEEDLDDEERRVIRALRFEPERVDHADGTTAFISVMPPIIQGSFSDLDWRIATKVEGLPNEFVSFNRAIVVVIALLIIAIWFSASIFARLFLEPIERVAGDACMIAANGDAQPHLERGSSTAYRLATSLTIIQGRLNQRRRVEPRKD